MCSEVACRAVDVVAPGALSSADVEWLVSARAQAYTLDQRVFGSWDGRDVFVTDIYVGVADAAGGFHPFRLSCTDGDVFNQLEV